MTLRQKYWDYVLKDGTATTAEAIVFDIVWNLSDRRGLKQEWQKIDEEVLEEILQTWVDIVEAKTNG